MADASPEHAHLVDRLRERGYVQTDPVERALSEVPREMFLHGVAGPLAGVDAPAPVAAPSLEEAACPSPRFASVMLEAAGIEPGDHVVLVGEGVAWMGALAAHLAGSGGSVTLVEEAPALRGIAREQLDGVGPARLRVADRAAPAEAIEAGSPDALVCTVPVREQEPLRELLAPEGVLVAPVLAGGERDLVRVSRQEGGFADLRLGETHVASQAEGLRGGRPGSSGGLTVTQLLQTEALLANAWTRRGGGTAVDQVQEAADETIGRALRERGLDEDEPERARAAQGAFEIGYVHQLTGEFGEAGLAYGASAAILETAEAYTFRGWTRSFADELEAAIEDCQRAIEVDPALGNPYNDVGAYLLELGRPREAVDWLEQATEAARYASPQFPHLNLGRAYLMLGERDEARDALERALEIDPGLEAARRLLERLGGGT